MACEAYRPVKDIINLKLPLDLVVSREESGVWFRNRHWEELKKKRGKRTGKNELMNAKKFLFFLPCVCRSSNLSEMTGQVAE